MATCVSAFAASGGYDSLPEIFPSTITPFSTTALAPKLFKLNIPGFQSISLSVALSTAPYASGITIFSYSGSLTPIGSVSLTAANTTFSIDLAAGQYVVCVHSTNTQSGSLVGSFTGYPVTPRFFPVAGSGEAVGVVLTTFPKPRICNEPLFFKIIDGQLPPGLGMDSLGTIRGRLPNLDCLEDRLSPSMDWWYRDIDGVAQPWGRQWRFRVQLNVAAQPDVTVEEWFCVSVHNNWDFDRDRFLKMLPFDREEQVAEVIKPDQLNPLCAPCVQVEERFKAQEIPLIVIGASEQTSVELIPIPESMCDMNVCVDDLLKLYEDSHLDETEVGRSFKSKLDSSEAFKVLRARAGFVPPDALTEHQRNLHVIAVDRYNDFIQLTKAQQIPGPNDTQFLFQLWKNAENQILPITAYAQSGFNCEVEVKWN